MCFNPYSAKGLGDQLYATLHKMPGEDAYSFCLFLKSKNSPLYTSGELAYINRCAMAILSGETELALGTIRVK